MSYTLALQSALAGWPRLIDGGNLPGENNEFFHSLDLCGGKHDVFLRCGSCPDVICSLGASGSSLA